MIQSFSTTKRFTNSSEMQVHLQYHLSSEETNKGEFCFYIFGDLSVDFYKSMVKTWIQRRAADWLAELRAEDQPRP